MANGARVVGAIGNPRAGGGVAGGTGFVPARQKADPFGNFIGGLGFLGAHTQGKGILDAQIFGGGLGATFDPTIGLGLGYATLRSGQIHSKNRRAKDRAVASFIAFQKRNEGPGNRRVGSVAPFLRPGASNPFVASQDAIANLFSTQNFAGGIQDPQFLSQARGMTASGLLNLFAGRSF